MSNTYKIAQVGAFKRFSEGDLARMSHFLFWLSENDKEFFRKKPEHDIVNLKYKRDFLDEKIKYDAVILHSVFHSDRFNHKFVRNGNVLTQISEKHTLDAWRNRLVDTAAYYILAFEGQPCSLSGWQLNDLIGYEILKRDTLFTVYRRILCS